MHEHHQETPIANSKEDLNHSEGMAPTISSDHFTDYADQLQIWFDLPTVRDHHRQISQTQRVPKSPHDN